MDDRPWGHRGGAEPDGDSLRAIGNRTVWALVRRSRAAATGLALLTLVQVASIVLTPNAVGAAIDAAVGGVRGSVGAAGLTPAVLWLAALLVVTTLAMGANDLVAAYLGSSLTARLRHRIAGQVLALGLAGQRRFPAGDVLTRLTDNAANPAGFLPLLFSAVATLITTLGAVVALALIDWRLAATFLLGVPFGVLLLRRFVVRASEPMTRYQRLQAAIMTRLLDAHRGARTISAAGTVERDVARVLEPLGELHDNGTRIWAAQRRASAQLSLLAPMLQVAVLAVGGYAVTTQAISPGQLVAAAGYAGMALGAIGLFDTAATLLTCQIGAGRVGELLECAPEVTSPSRPKALPPQGRGRWELRAVTVRRGGRTILDNLDLTVPAGATVALVGRSGVGKSVLANLAGRLLDPDSGSVRLDGVEEAEVALPELRRAVAYAFERPAALGVTVADTIAYGREGTTRQEIEGAAAVAEADRFIRLLPDSYGTDLARAPMSGGELQRLGLARAALGAARLVVLDDATSSLDTATEAKVSEALRVVLAGRTSVVVAHRAGTAGRADLVAWLDEGRIRALAPHATLWSDPGYRAVFAAEEVDRAEPVDTRPAEADAAVLP